MYDMLARDHPATFFDSYFAQSYSDNFNSLSGYRYVS